MRLAILIAGLLAGSCTLDRSPLAPAPRDGALASVDGGSRDAGSPDGAGPDRDAGRDGGRDAGPGDAGPPRGVVGVAAGQRFTCALRADGEVRCWGDNAAGQLGGGTAGGSSEAAVTVALEGPAIRIAAGGAHACALLEDARLFCWGANDKGQVDGAMAHPVPAPTLVHDGVRAVALGGKHSCLIDAVGAAHCWGFNGEGQLGLGDRADRDAPEPVPFDGTWLALALGGDHSCGIADDATLWCWGRNDAGQVGDDSTSRRQDPVQIESIGAGVVSAGAGGRHTCAVRAGVGLCWGDGGDGRLGTGSGDSQRVPTVVVSLNDPLLIEGGVAHSCVLRTEGRVSCWGKDDSAQLGPSATGTSGRNTPLGVPLIGTASALAVGGHHNCVIIEGQVHCWGRDDVGQLGSGASGASPTEVPVAVPDVSP